jgi:membrane protease YdiL (CAAX protease family)
MTAGGGPLALLQPTGDLGFGELAGGSGAVLKAVLPLLAYLLAAPALWLFFRRTWRELDHEATDRRQQLRLSGATDYRPAVMFAITALVLTMQEYYGGQRFFLGYVRPWLRDIELQAVLRPEEGPSWVDMRFWGELYAYAWWAVTRILGYTLVPLAIWKLIYRKDSLLDMGLRIRGLREHIWIYGLCLAVVVPLVFAVSRSPDFASYYPFYKLCSRSWLDLALWEGMYVAQFFALEVFFRGFMLAPLRRTFGSGAVFAMCVPYVMIHYGKPYLEAQVAFLAGVALGSLSMKTRSIYSGFLVHVTVALLMDTLALLEGPGLPSQLWPR